MAVVVEAFDYILVVDDSPTQALQMQMLREQAGYRVGIAKDGVEALEMVRANEPSLVVTDLYMPNKNGLELVDDLKNQCPSLPVVLTTAKGNQDIAAEALRRGAASYVPKKNLELELVSTAERILSVVHPQNKRERLENAVLAKHLELSIENDNSLVPQVIGQLEENVRQMGFCDENELVQIATALDEALLNAMIHGNLEVSSELRQNDDGRPYIEMIKQRREQTPYQQRRVYVSAKATADEAVFIIRDEGRGFDPKSIPDPTDPANLENLSGRGLLLINAFMDEVRHNAKGNEITMIKRKNHKP